MKKKRAIVNNGKSLRITIPNSIVQFFDLTTDNKVIWEYDKQNDCFILKFTD